MDGYDRNRPEIVRVSKAYTIMSRATAFLVLENERMYREFGVKRTRTRNRGYWSGRGVSTRTARNGTETAKDSMDKNKAPDAPTATTSTEKQPAGEVRQQAPVDSLASAADSSRAAAGKSSSGARLKDAEDADEAEPSRASRAPAPMSTPVATAPRPARAAPPPHKPMTRARPKVKKMRSARRRPVEVVMDPFGKGRARYHRRPYYVTVRRARIQPMLAVSSTPTELRSEARLQRLVAAHPLRRYYRRALHRRLVLSGQYDRALRHARKWASLDGSHAAAVSAMADMQAATGRVGEAMRTYSATVEVSPYSRRLHRHLARMYRNKGDLNHSCSHLWSILSLRPSVISRHLELARCLSAIPQRREQAVRILTELSATPLGRSHAALIGRTLAQVQSASGATVGAPSRRGAMVVTATWSLPEDLDVALITPRGERICALRGGRQGEVEQDSVDGLTPEVLRLRHAGAGQYRVEISRPAGASSGKTITGTILVQALGRSQTIPFSLAGASTPLASVRVSYHRVPGGYYR